MATPRLIDPPHRKLTSSRDVTAKAACARALDAGASIRSAAGRVIDEIDEVTDPNGRVITGLDDADSAVVVVDDAIKSMRKR